MRNCKLIILLIVFTILLTSCTQQGEYVPVELEKGSVGQLYQKKSDFINTKTVTLYYPDLTSDNLLRIVKEANIPQSGSEVRVIATKLLNSAVTEEDNYIVPFGGIVSVDWLIVSRNLATINLKGDFSIFTEKEMFTGIVSLVNTICQLNSIDYVEVLLNGEQMKNRGLLVNPMSAMSTELHLMYLEHVNIIEDGERKISKDKNILYFLDTNSNFLIAEISNMSVSKENAAEDLFKLLKNEPYYGSGIQSCVPQNVLMPTGAVMTEENEMNILTLRLESPKIEIMDNKTRYMMCGGIALTLLSYYDDVQAVRIMINGQPALEDSLLTKETFIENVGQMVSVYLPNRDLDYLMTIGFAMSQDRYNSPKERVNEIILADADYKANTAKIISEGVTEEDIKAVFVHDTCCVVNISEELYAKISVLPYNNRKMFLYSIVNTLTEFENINSVQFLVEGIIKETLGDDLYIETPMLNNPGLVYD